MASSFVPASAPVGSFLDNVRTRIASPRAYWRKVKADPRYAIYDILPIVTDPASRLRRAFLREPDLRGAVRGDGGQFSGGFSSCPRP